jgi:hypothetical protein
MRYPKARATVISSSKGANPTTALRNLWRPIIVSCSAILKRMSIRHLLTLLLVVDIINVVSVTGQANVTHWLEENDEEILNSLYWRQALDTRTLELSVSHRSLFLTYCIS